MIILSEFNEIIEKQKPTGYNLLLVHQIRVELTNNYPNHIHVGKEVFFWLSELVDCSRGAFDGKVRIYTSNMDKHVDVHLDYQKKEHQSVKSISLNDREVLIGRFENGHERYQTVSEFRTCLDAIMTGGDIHGVLDQVLLSNEELRNRLEQEINKGNG